MEALSLCDARTYLQTHTQKCMHGTALYKSSVYMMDTHASKQRETTNTRSMQKIAKCLNHRQYHKKKKENRLCLTPHIEMIQVKAIKSWHSVNLSHTLVDIVRSLKNAMFSMHNIVNLKARFFV